MPWRKLPPDIQRELLRDGDTPPNHPLAVYEALQRYYDRFRRAPPMRHLLDRSNEWIVRCLDQAVVDGVPITADELDGGSPLGDGSN